MQNFRKKIKLSLLYEVILPFFLKRELAAWQKRGKTNPTPHLIKQSYIKRYATKNSITIFVETGTYLGNMVSATKNIFSRIYTIEIDDTLFRRAKKKFTSDTHITVHKGDSSKILPKILKQIKKPALFWLDAHYSKEITGKGTYDTPILNEIKYILHHSIPGHVVLVDDAALFSGKIKDYPSLKKLKDIIWNSNPDLKISVKDGIIFIH